MTILRPSGYNRRKILKLAGASSATMAVSGIFAPAVHAAKKLKIGYVSPHSGPLAAFAEADNFVVRRFAEATNGRLQIRGTDHEVEVLVKDSQSNPNRAAEVAKELIVDDEVNLMLVASTPETTNPVATICEAEQVPCISTVAPWEPWFIGQQGNPTDPGSWAPFDYAYHFFFGAGDGNKVFLRMWSQIETNKRIAGLFPNDTDGNAMGSETTGIPPSLRQNGYTLTDPGRYQNLTDDFSAQINAFKAADCELLVALMIPPDFTTFWNQAKQQGFMPKIATISKAILFPQAVEALGDVAHNLSTEVWWSASHPFKSSLTGESSAEVAAGFTQATGRPWTQPIGFVHALFELAVDVVKRADDPTDRDAVAVAIAATRLDTLVGPVAWDGANLPPFAAKNVATTPLVGGQWRLKDGGGYDLVITDNSFAPEVPTAGEFEPIA